MTVDFTNQERQFLVNLLLNPDQAAPVPDPHQSMLAANAVKAGDLNPRQVAFVQEILQVQNEVWGRISSVANEKVRDIPFRFRAHNTLVMVKSISDKLGASMSVDLESRSDLHSPNEEGSRGVMGHTGQGTS